MSSPRNRPTPDALRFDAGAPWLDLLATVGNAYGRAPIERLTTVERLSQWLAREGLSPVRLPDAADLAAARRLRETLRPLARAAVTGQPVDPAAVSALNAVLAAEQPRQLQVDDHHRFVLSPPATTAAALAQLARQAAADLAGPAAGALHRCADDACGMIFLDPTGRRRWCAPNRCGVRARVRAHRHRQHR